MEFGPTRVNRSTSLSVSGLASWNTTPVSARIAEPLMQVLSDVRPSIERNDARAVNHFRSNRHIARTLEDLEIVVIDDRQVRRLVGADDAAHGQREVQI